MGQNNLLHLALQKTDFAGEAVRFDYELGFVDNAGHVNSDDMFGSCSCREPVGVSIRLHRLL
jgi:hypothetical protein